MENSCEEGRTFHRYKKSVKKSVRRAFFENQLEKMEVVKKVLRYDDSLNAFNDLRLQYKKLTLNLISVERNHSSRQNLGMENFI